MPLLDSLFEFESGTSSDVIHPYAVILYSNIYIQTLTAYSFLSSSGVVAVQPSNSQVLKTLS